jgi:transcriptional regulator with XRE-family HTH domain
MSRGEPSLLGVSAGKSHYRYRGYRRNVITRPVSPSLRVLGAAVRRYREAAGLTQERLAGLINYSKVWMSNLETGQVHPYRQTIIDIEKALKLPPRVLLDIFELVKYEEPQPGVACGRYADAERRARVIRQYTALVVPELLQTPEYARALIAAAHPTAKPEVIDGLLGDRLKRQEILAGDAPPTLWLVVDEGVLHRPVGGREVHIAQLDALIEAVQQPHVGCQVIPLSTGAHPGLMGSFTIVGFADDPEIVYTQDHETGHLRERPEIVRSWFQAFEALRMVTLPGSASLELIRSVREKL